MNNHGPGAPSAASSHSLGDSAHTESAGKRKASPGVPATWTPGSQEDPQPLKRSKKGAGGGTGRKNAGGRNKSIGGGRGSALLREAPFAFLAPLPPNSELLAEGGRPVKLSKVDKAPQVSVSEDRLSATSCKGYRMARATHGAYEGTWYYEVTIARLGPTGHSRVGWATVRAEIQAPVGFDTRGFGYRDLQGSKVHDTRREAYGEAYREGDVIGCWLHMPDGGRPFAHTPADVRNYRSHLHLVVESPQAPQPQPLKGSAIAFTRNGILQGIAFRDVPEGTYLPAVSLFTDQSQTEGVRLTCNFGPDFVHPPPKVEDFPEARPVCQLSTPQEKPQDAASNGIPPPASSAAAAATANGLGTPTAALACIPATADNTSASMVYDMVADRAADVSQVRSASAAEAPVECFAKKDEVRNHVASDHSLCAERESMGEAATVLPQPSKLPQQHLKQTVPVKPG